MVYTTVFKRNKKRPNRRVRNIVICFSKNGKYTGARNNYALHIILFSHIVRCVKRNSIRPAFIEVFNFFRPFYFCSKLYDSIMNRSSFSAPYTFNFKSADLSVGQRAQLAFCRIISYRVDINMRFRASSSSGLLLWSGRQADPQEQRDENDDFLALGLDRGYLTLAYNLGSGEAVLRYNLTRLDDDLWHRVRAVR